MDFGRSGDDLVVEKLWKVGCCVHGNCVAGEVASGVLLQMMRWPSKHARVGCQSGVSRVFPRDGEAASATVKRSVNNINRTYSRSHQSGLCRLVICSNFIRSIQNLQVQPLAPCLTHHASATAINTCTTQHSLRQDIRSTRILYSSWTLMHRFSDKLGQELLECRSV